MNIDVMPGSRKKMIILLGGAALILAIALLLSVIPIEGIPARFTADEAVTTTEIVATQHVVGRRGADRHSQQLVRLQQLARKVTAGDATTEHVALLSRLASSGRQAALEAQLPNSSDEYVAYHATLRRMGRQAALANKVPADANAYAERLNELRRLDP